MNKKTGIMITSMQICFFNFMLIISIADNYPSQEIFEEYFFPLAAITCVILSPFGMFSVIFSFAIPFMFRQRLMSRKDLDRLEKHPVFRFLIWDEVWSDLREGRRHE